MSTDKLGSIKEGIANGMPRDTLKMLLDVGASLAAPVTLGDLAEPFIVVPNGYDTKGLNEFLPLKRIKQLVRFDDPDSFVAYVNRFKMADTLIFAQFTKTGGEFMAYIDYHGPQVKGTEAVPRHCDHIAAFKVQSTDDWNTWCSADRQRMSQVDFATWLEENMRLIATPPGAELLEFIQNLEGKSNVRFNSAIRLNNGKNSLNYDEDVEVRSNVSTQSGQIEVPREITAGITPFEGQEAYSVRARLKYRIDSKKVCFWFETIDKNQIVRECLKQVLDKVASGTGIKPLLGTVSA